MCARAARAEAWAFGVSSVERGVPWGSWPVGCGGDAFHWCRASEVVVATAWMETAAVTVPAIMAVIHRL